MKRSTKRVVAYTFAALFFFSLLSLIFAVVGDDTPITTEVMTTQVDPPFTAPAQKLKITAAQVKSWEGIRVIFVAPGAKLHVFKNVLEFPTSSRDQTNPDGIVSINYVDPNGVVYEDITVTQGKIKVRAVEDHVGYPTASIAPTTKFYDGSNSSSAELDRYIDMICIDLEPQ